MIRKRAQKPVRFWVNLSTLLIIIKNRIYQYLDIVGCEFPENNQISTILLAFLAIFWQNIIWKHYQKTCQNDSGEISFDFYHHWVVLWISAHCAYYCVPKGEKCIWAMDLRGRVSKLEDVVYWFDLIDWSNKLHFFVGFLVHHAFNKWKYVLVSQIYSPFDAFSTRFESVTFYRYE